MKSSRGIHALGIVCVALAACAPACPCPAEVPSPASQGGGAIVPPTGDQSSIVFRDTMSRAFRLTRVLLVTDGRVSVNREFTVERPLPSEIVVFSGRLEPGEHTVQVLFQLSGNGELNGYKFEVKSSHSFPVKEGQPIRLYAIAWEKDGATTPFEQRPALRYVETFGVPQPSQSAASPGEKTAPNTVRAATEIPGAAAPAQPTAPTPLPASP